MRSEELAKELTRDVEAMRAFEAVVEESPALQLVLAPDLNAKVMYVNQTALRLLSSTSTSCTSCTSCTSSTSSINSSTSGTSSTTTTSSGRSTTGSSGVLGRSFYSLIHPDDAVVLSPFLQRLILSRGSSRGPPLQCRLWKGGREGEVVETQMCVAYGRQGLVCSLWVEEMMEVGKKGGRKGGWKLRIEAKEGQVQHQRHSWTM